jgi:hypothetical protein
LGALTTLKNVLTFEAETRTRRMTKAIGMLAAGKKEPA